MGCAAAGTAAPPSRADPFDRALHDGRCGESCGALERGLGRAFGFVYHGDNDITRIIHGESRREGRNHKIPCITSRIRLFCRYSGRCRTGLSHADRPFAIRLRVTDTPLIFRDAVQGEHRQRLTDDVGDFAIRRADGLFAYQLAVVVDDAAQGVTQVVRGCDLLDSTPRQIYLQQALGLPTPRYAHLPVATDRRGRKLSKQTGATALDLLDPAPALWAALDFLGQAPSPDVRREPPATILAWALAGWRLDAVPATPSRRWLDADVARHVTSDRQESDRRAIDKAKDVV